MSIKKILHIIFVLTILFCMSYLGFKTYSEAKKYEMNTIRLAKMTDANGLASERIDQLTSILSLGLVKNSSKLALQKLKKEQQEAKIKSKNYFLYYLYSLIFILFILLTCNIQCSAMILSSVTLIALIYGLINPILMVTIHTKVEYLGDVILSFESKGIIGSIVKLFEHGELAVSMTILLFSVALPLVKSLTLTIILIFKNHLWSVKLLNFFKYLGKWSMLDVFVVATFLVYITTNGGKTTHAEIQVGLYFFLIYVILSMVTALLTQKVLYQEAQKAILSNKFKLLEN